MKKIYIIFSLILFSVVSKAQQDPEYTHYMYNMSVVNPGYATGNQAMLDLGGFYRAQWVGAVGGPNTINAFGHMPVNKKIEVGVSVISDEIGDGAKKENNFYADLAYVLQLNNQHRVSFGMKAGFTNLTTNFNGFRLESGNTSTDLAFNQNINVFKPSLGAGAFYFTDKYYISLSAPNLIPTKHIEERSGIHSIGSENIHVFLTGGYVFQVSDMWKVKPALMTKFVPNAPLSVDVTANVLYNDRFELGAAYRWDDSVSGLMAIKATKSIKVGYSYDYTLSNLGQFNSGTHEIFLLFNLDLLGRGYDKSPRFF